MSVVYFLLLLGALIVIHEFGHFVVAKLLDFKVLRFSVGFGRPLARFRGRETEYQLSVFPLGGYVRILGEDPADIVDPTDAARSFPAKPLWQRLAVVFAGPAANLLLPIPIYFILYAGHTKLPAAVVGDVLPHSPAAAAGLEPGDRIVSVDGTSVRYWQDLERIIDDRVGRELRFRIERNDREFDKLIVPVGHTRRARDGRETRHGIIGITEAPFPPRIAVVDSGGPAHRDGLRTGDLVISIDGKPVENWAGLERALGRSPNRSTVAYLRGADVPGLPHVRLLEPATVDFVPDTVIDGTGRRRVRTGIAPFEMLVRHVDAGSPADRAGLRPGDLITSLDSQPLSHWMLLDQRLQSQPTRAWTLGWLRADGDTTRAMTGTLTQERVMIDDEYGTPSEHLVFGAANEVARGHGVLIPIEGRFSYAAAKAVERTGETIVEMIGGFWGLLGGDKPHESVAGPITMYRVASVSGSKGWDTFLLMLALVSVNLGLINLLPIPVLDGGHLLVFAVETARRKPLSRRAKDRILVGGLVVVAAITVLALRNDVMRYLVR